MAKPTASRKSPPAAKPRAKGNGKKPNGNGKKANANGKAIHPAGKKPVAAKALAATKPDKAKAAPPPPKGVDKKTRQQLDLEGKLLHLIAEEMAIEEAELTPNALLKDDLTLDQIDVAELLMQAEVNFNLHPFSESDWDACKTVGDYLAMVSKRIEAKRGRKRV